MLVANKSFSEDAFPFTIHGFTVTMQMPCSFFNPNTGKCTNYKNRPLACRMFPFTPIPPSKEENPYETTMVLSKDCSCYDLLQTLSRTEAQQFLQDDYGTACMIRVEYIARLTVLLDVMTPRDKHILLTELQHTADTLVQEISEGSPEQLLGTSSPEAIYNHMIKDRIQELTAVKEDMKTLYVRFLQFKRDHGFK